MEILYQKSPVSFQANELLFNAQLLADAFADALKQNNCIVMLPIAIHDEIETGIKDIEDGEEIIKDQEKPLPDGGGNTTDQILDSIRDSINYSKSRCYSCNLTIPRVNFDYDMSGVMGDIKVTLDTYNSIFNLPRMDLCQSAYALKDNCLPDILKLIVLLLTAYASIMMLKSITSISMQAFIKGVLSTIISKIFAAIRISVGIGDTNMACLINALQEISASLIPTDANVMSMMHEDDKEAIGYRKDTSVFDNQYTKALNEGLERGSNNVQNIEQTINMLETKLEETFKIVSDTLNEATQEVNDLILNMLALKSTFECESARSGTDVKTVMDRVNRLIQTVNMLSAVALATARQDSYERACASNRSIKRLTDKQLENQKIKDIVEEYYEKEVEIIENPDTGIQIIIKEDKPKPPVLSKLNFFQCSIDDFINDHTIDEIINKVEKENEERGTPIRDPVERDDPGYIDKGTYVIPPISPENLNIIEDIVNILRIPPDEDASVDNNIEDTDNTITTPTTDIEDIINSFGTDSVSSEYTIQNKGISNTSLNCRSPREVLDILEKMRKTV